MIFRGSRGYLFQLFPGCGGGGAGWGGGGVGWGVQLLPYINPYNVIFQGGSGPHLVVSRGPYRQLNLHLALSNLSRLT